MHARKGHSQTTQSFKNESFTFLGRTILGSENRIQKCLTLASQAFGCMDKQIWLCKISIQMKVRSFRYLIIPNLIHNADLDTQDVKMRELLKSLK